MMLRFAGCLLLMVGAGLAWSQESGGQVPALSDSAVATAASVEGTVYVTRQNGRQGLLVRGAGVQQGETIHTARNSVVRLKLADGGETVIRPESSLVLQDFRYKASEPADDSLVLRLIRGGLRAVTGAVGKRGNQDAYKLITKTATIGIRGTDFSARVCDQDCGEPLRAAQGARATPVAARAVQLVGAVSVSRGNAPTALALDKPLYPGDIVETGPGAYAVLVFRDNARLTVNPSTRFVLTRYEFDTTAKGEPPSMFVELLKGGLRFATGLIGKSNPRMVQLRTATATLGIRGTVFDFACGPASSPDAATQAQLGAMSCDQSLFVNTRSGTVVMSGDLGGELLVFEGQSGRVDGAQMAARAIDGTPEYFKSLSTPVPESFPAKLDQLFGVQASGESDNGVYVTVHEGRVLLAQGPADVTLDAGESAFAGQSLVPVKLFNAPGVLDRDPFLSSGRFTSNMCRR
jgi:hypothetical protein